MASDSTDSVRPRGKAISAGRLAPAAAALLAIVACCWAPEASAQPAKKWVQASEADFAAGKCENVALTSIGELKLGRQRDLLAEKAGEHVWAMAIDSKGVVYAATGSSGEIFKIVDGKPELFYKSEEPEITSLVVDKADNLYAGTSPGGLVYKFTPKADPEIYLDTKETYIWGLAFNSKGALYAATGDKGKLLKIAEKGKSEVVFETKDPHILDVVVDSKDNVYVCTNKSGLVFRIDPAGKAYALFDSDDEEMHSLVVDEADNLYVCTADGMQPGSAGPSTREGPSGPPPAENAPGPAAGKEGKDSSADSDDPEGEDEPPKGEPNPPHVKPLPPPPPAIGPRPPVSGAPVSQGINFVYKITPDGLVTSLFRREGAALLSMVYQSGSIYLGTANQGQLLKLDENLQVTLIAQVDQPQITSLVAAPDGTLYFGTAGDAKVYRLGGKLAKEGTFTSVVKDMTYPSQWGALRYQGDTPDKTSIAVSTRAGNVAEPDKTWSDWSAEQANPAGVKIASPVGRFMQYRLRLKSGADDAVPLVRAVEVAYLPPNYRPRLGGISFPQSEQIGPPPGRGGPSAPARGPATDKSVIKPLRGPAEINWQAEDPNFDQLKYEVFVKGAAETSWKSIAEKLRDPRLTWNTVRVPDGVYRLKVKADDELSNPPGRSLSTEEVSEPFTIDNTPPSVTIKTNVEADGKVSVAAELTDAASAIDDAAYSVDSGTWVMLSPNDGIFDSPKENVSVKTDALKPGEHTIVINVRDAAGNIGAGKAVVVVPGK